MGCQLPAAPLRVAALGWQIPGSTDHETVARIRLGFTADYRRRSGQIISSQDILKGEQWGVLQEEFATSEMALIRVTAENLNSPWLNFEAEVIARPVDNPIYSFLFGIEESALPGPLKQFQATYLLHGVVNT